jgi:hypothetical protein
MGEKPTFPGVVRETLLAAAGAVRAGCPSAAVHIRRLDRMLGYRGPGQPARQPAACCRGHGGADPGARLVDTAHSITPTHTPRWGG